jgi:hypothetical protein
MHHFIEPVVINALKHVTKQPNLASITNEKNSIEAKASSVHNIKRIQNPEPTFL